MSDEPTIRRPTVLPGVGERLDLRDADDRPIVAIRRRDGHVELHADRHSIEFTHDSAHALAAFASGRYRIAGSLSSRVDDVLGGLQFDWAQVERSSFAAGRTIEQLAIRRRTGVTVVAILRGSQPIVAPEPTTMLEPGDELVVACRPSDFESFEQFLRTGRV